MTIGKDSTLKCNVKGIYVILNFSEGQCVSFKEENTNLLNDNNVTLSHINKIIKNRTTTFVGEVKAVLTIFKKDFKHVYEKSTNDFLQTIMNCIIDENYLTYVNCLIWGYPDGIDTYDENYTCDLCKLFSTFYKVPKLKLLYSINDKKLKNILYKWLDDVVFNNILIDGKYVFYCYNLLDKYKIQNDTIKWIKRNNNYDLYLNIDNKLLSIDTSLLYATDDNDLIEDNMIYMLKDKLVSHNIFNIIYENIIQLDNVKFVNGRFKLINIGDDK